MKLIFRETDGVTGNRLTFGDGAIPDGSYFRRVGRRIIGETTLRLSAAGPTDDLDVTGISTVFIDTSSNNVILGGTIGGTNGQVLRVVVHDKTNNATIENEEGSGNQDFFLHAGADEILTGEYGGWVFVNDGGDHWHDASHAKHV